MKILLHIEFEHLMRAICLETAWHTGSITKKTLSTTIIYWNHCPSQGTKFVSSVCRRPHLGWFLRASAEYCWLMLTLFDFDPFPACDAGHSSPETTGSLLLAQVFFCLGEDEEGWDPKEGSVATAWTWRSDFLSCYHRWSHWHLKMKQPLFRGRCRPTGVYFYFLCSWVGSLKKNTRQVENIVYKNTTFPMQNK